MFFFIQPLLQDAVQVFPLRHPPGPLFAGQHMKRLQHTPPQPFFRRVLQPFFSAAIVSSPLSKPGSISLLQL